jgi:hypothetical protein
MLLLLQSQLALLPLQQQQQQRGALAAPLSGAAAGVPLLQAQSGGCLRLKSLGQHQLTLRGARLTLRWKARGRLVKDALLAESPRCGQQQQQRRRGLQVVLLLPIVMQTWPTQRLASWSAAATAVGPVRCMAGPKQRR